MGSHFASIGFSVDRDEDLIELAERASVRAERIETRHGSYLRWSGASGAQLWLQVDRDHRLVGMNPHFEGSSSLEVLLTDVLRRPPLALDGAFVGQIVPADPAQAQAPPLRIAFDCPSFRACDDVELPSMATVQLAAFAHELRVFDSPEAYAESLAGEAAPLPSQAFVPSGLLRAARGLPPTLALIAGHVRRAELRENALGGRAFYCLSVLTSIGVLDLVADPDLVQEPPCFGGVVAGSFWVSGRLVRYARKRPSFIRRLLTPAPMPKVGS